MLFIGISNHILKFWWVSTYLAIYFSNELYKSWFFRDEIVKIKIFIIWSPHCTIFVSLAVNFWPYHSVTLFCAAIARIPHFIEARFIYSTGLGVGRLEHLISITTLLTFQLNILQILVLILAII